MGVTENILVLGSTGRTGRRVARRLMQSGWPVRLGSRNQDVPFDWENRLTWQPVLQNVHAVYVSFQPDLGMPGAAATIDAFAQLAATCGVQKLVLLSCRGESGAQQCEQAIMQHAADWTILRASWFMQNFSESYLREPLLAGYVSLPVDEVGEPFVDADDIADCAVSALTQPQHSKKIYDLTGPQLFSFKQAVHAIAHATGSHIHFESIPIERYTALLEWHGVPTPIITLLRHLFIKVLDGRNEYTTNDIEKVLGRKPTDFFAFVKNNAAQGIWRLQPITSIPGSL